MYRALLFFPLFAAIWIQNPTDSVGNVANAMVYSQLTGDTLLLRDTIQLNSEMLLVSKTYKITDTISRPVIVNGQWLTKRITVTDYVALPSDTIWLSPKSVANSKTATTTTVAKVQESKKPEAKAKEVPITASANPVKKEVKSEKSPKTDSSSKVDDKLAVVSPEKEDPSPIVPVAQIAEQPLPVRQTQEQELPQNNLTATLPTETEPTFDLPVLKPSSQKASKEKTNKKNPQPKKATTPQSKTEPEPAETSKPELVIPTPVVEQPKQTISKIEAKETTENTSSKAITTEPIPPKTEPVVEKTPEPKSITPAEKAEVMPNNISEPKEIAGISKEDDDDNEFLIEVIDERRVIGLRTDLPDDNLPPGGTVLIKVVQPIEVAPIQVQQQSSENAPVKIPPFAPPLPDKTDKTSSVVSTKQVETNPVQTNSSASFDTVDSTHIIETPNPQRTPSPERILIESRPITMSEAYQLTLSDVQKQRKEFAKQYKKAKTEEEANDVLLLAGRYLEEVIANDIVYYWYGTGFDKEGMSSSPGNGRIACSYFVVTMLTEAGLNIDRVKLAQQSALNIVKTLSTPELVTHCSAPDEVETLLLQKGTGLYFIGFSYHVGFLYYDGKEMHLIHASPLPPGTVSRISMKGARSFEYSNFYDIGKLTENKSLIINWLTGGKVQILP